MRRFGTMLLAMLLSLLAGSLGSAQEGEAVDIAPAVPVADPPAEEEVPPSNAGPEAAVVPAPGAAATLPAPAGGTTAQPIGAGQANVAESGATSGGTAVTLMPRGDAPGAGIATGTGAVVAQPQSDGAGNAADITRGGPGGRGTSPNAADSVNPAADAQVDTGVPGDLQTDRRLFGDDLPGFARQQPGAVTGMPGDMMTSGTPVEGFSTLLGTSNLPTGTMPDILGRVQGNPSYELMTNFGRLIVPTGTITGSTATKQFKITGGLTLYYDRVTITAENAEIDEKSEIAVLSGSVVINDPKYTMSTDELRIRFEDKLFQATGFVQFKKHADSEKSRPNLSLPKKDRLREYFAGQQFELYCMDLHYNWDTKQLIALESVRLVHPSFAGTMDRVDYDDKSKVYAINGNVKLDMDQYEWIFANQLADAADEEKARALTNKPTVIQADRLLYSEETGLAQFFSQPGKKVIFDQTERKIEGAYIEINDTTKDFHVEGTTAEPLTYNQANGEWLMAGGLIKREEVSQELRDALANPLTATAQRMTYNFDRKRLELTGAVKMNTEGKSLQADRITQDETAKFFLMEGNVVIEPDAESKVYAAQVYLDTANDVVSFVGLVQGQFTNDDIAAAAAPANAGGAIDPTLDTSGLFGNPSGGLLPGGSGGSNIAERR